MKYALMMAVAVAAADAVAFYPQFGRPTTSLDGEGWTFSFDPDFGDSMRPIVPSSIKTHTGVTIPSAFDVVQPGVVGPRGVGFYRTTTTALKPNHRGRLNFAACAFFCRVFVDGVELGTGPGGHFAGGYSPFWLDVPPSNSSNAREIFVLADNRFNKTTAPTHTGGDFYMYGGITRSVVLHDVGPAGDGPTKPFSPASSSSSSSSYIDFVGVVPVNTSAVNVTLRLRGGAPGSREKVSVRFDQLPSPQAIIVAAGDGELTATVAGVAVPGARPRSPASPALHTVTATVMSNGDAVTMRFGLRTLGISPQGGHLLLNGQPLQLRGVNRHTMTAASGSALTLDEVRRDVALLKKLGANFVRGAHYPQDQRFLDLCDEQGLLVWEETLGPNVVSDDTLSPNFMAAQLTQVEEMVLSSFNHPSIILHGFFNEGPSTNKSACAHGYSVMAAKVRSLVPRSHRLITWASSAKEQDVCFDAADVIAFNEYPGWYTETFDTVNATWAGFAAWAKSHYPSKPFMISETGGGAIFEWRNRTAGPMRQNYTLETGAMAAGGDLDAKNCTWREAAAHCNSTTACVGFTFAAANATPGSDVLQVYFKQALTNINTDARWHSWVKGKARPPKWSQEYQQSLVAADVMSALSLWPVVAGISLWQFSDIKADDGANQACKSCVYSTPYDASTPMNCSVIEASCWRPGGENHKGLVDFWRREKLSFGVVATLYRGVQQ